MADRTCLTCGKVFKFPSQLTRHLEGKKECKAKIPNQLDTCIHCNIQFSNKYSLIRHLNTCKIKKQNELNNSNDDNDNDNNNNQQKQLEIDINKIKDSKNIDKKLIAYLNQSNNLKNQIFQLMQTNMENDKKIINTLLNIS